MKLNIIFFIGILTFLTSCNELTNTRTAHSEKIHEPMATAGAEKELSNNIMVIYQDTKNYSA